MVKENLKQVQHLIYKEKLQMQISVLVCDDDEEFVRYMVGLLQAQPESNYIKITACSKPEKLTDKLLSSFQIIFLDVDMGDYNGLEIARRIRKLKLDTILIFVTNYMEYSPDGYEVNAFRYLLKANIKEKLANYLKEAIHELHSHTDRLLFTIGGEECFIKHDDILYLESRQRQIYIHLVKDKNADKYFYSVMDEQENNLNSVGFLRVHKSYLVNMQYIEKLNYNKLLLTNGEELPVGQRRYAEIKTKYLHWRSIQ